MIRDALRDLYRAHPSFAAVLVLAALLSLGVACALFWALVRLLIWVFSRFQTM